MFTGQKRTPGLEEAQRVLFAETSDIFALQTSSPASRDVAVCRVHVYVAGLHAGRFRAAATGSSILRGQQPKGITRHRWSGRAFVAATIPTASSGPKPKARGAAVGFKMERN